MVAANSPGGIGVLYPDGRIDWLQEGWPDGVPQHQHETAAALQSVQARWWKRYIRDHPDEMKREMGELGRIIHEGTSDDLLAYMAEEIAEKATRAASRYSAHVPAAAAAPKESEEA